MKKQILFSILAVVTIVSLVTPCFAVDENSFAVGPPNLSVSVQPKGSNTTFIYITSTVNGTLIVGTEDLPFNVEPATIQITSTDRTRKIELTVHGNASLTGGQYVGKVTLLLFTESNVAHGVKLNANVTQSPNEPNLIDQIAQSLWIISIIVLILVAVTSFVYINRSQKRKKNKRNATQK
jgi:hypothetical protein